MSRSAVMFLVSSLVADGTTPGVVARGDVDGGAPDAAPKPPSRGAFAGAPAYVATLGKSAQKGAFERIMALHGRREAARRRPCR